MEHLFGRHRYSIWLAFISFAFTAVMMHPSGASFMAVGVNLVILVLLRQAALYEGRYQKAHRKGFVE